MTDIADARMYDFWKTAATLAERGNFKRLAREYSRTAETFRLKLESDVNRRQKMLDEETKKSPTANGPGRQWVADRHFRSGDMIFNRGCAVPDQHVSDKLIRAGFIVPLMASAVNFANKPVAAPVPEPPTPKLVNIFKENWPSSWRATAAQPGCNPSLAKQLLLNTEEGKRQNEHYQRVESERRAHAANLYGRRIVPADL